MGMICLYVYKRGLHVNQCLIVLASAILVKFNPIKI